jgi:hypothetical protein
VSIEAIVSQILGTLAQTMGSELLVGMHERRIFAATAMMT